MSLNHQSYVYSGEDERLFPAFFKKDVVLYSPAVFILRVSATIFTGVQLCVFPDQRSECWHRAASYTISLCFSSSLSSPRCLCSCVTNIIPLCQCWALYPQMKLCIHSLALLILLKSSTAIQDSNSAYETATPSKGHLGGGCFPGRFYRATPSCRRYISGLTAPSDNLIRRSLYHLM